MTAPGFIDTYPHTFHPVVDGTPDDTRTVEVFQLRPGDQARLIDWSGSGIALADGGVVLTSGATILGRLALGEFAVRDGTAVSVATVDGFLQRYIPQP